MLGSTVLAALSPVMLSQCWTCFILLDLASTVTPVNLLDIAFTRYRFFCGKNIGQGAVMEDTDGQTLVCCDISMTATLVMNTLAK